MICFINPSWRVLLWALITGSFSCSVACGGAAESLDARVDDVVESAPDAAAAVATSSSAFAHDAAAARHATSCFDAAVAVDACASDLPACLGVCVADALDAGADTHSLDSPSYASCKSACYACVR